MFTGPQLHLMLNHVPIIGFFLMLPVLFLTLLSKRVDYKRIALLGVSVIGLLALPAFFTGEPAEEGVEHMPGISENLIKAHEEAAELALILALVTAGLATVSWIATRKNSTLLTWAMPVVTIAALGTSETMAWVGHEGGKIRHPEINGTTNTSSIDAQKDGVTEEEDDDDH
jgi:hypothetical protein